MGAEVERDGDFVMADGARLGFRRDGAGPVLVMLHGGATDHRCFDPILDRLTGSFDVVRYDRRGHGMSANEAIGTLAQDVSDLLTILRVLGGASVFGYSFGGLVATLAVASEPDTGVEALVVYEPPFNVEGIAPGNQAIRAQVAAGDDEGALRTFVSTTFDLPNAVIDAMTAHPMWAVSIALAPSLPHEIDQLLDQPVPRPEHEVPPIRVLVAEAGGNAAFREIASELGDRLGADVVTVPGIPHFAIASAPGEVAAAILAFLEHR